MSAPGFEAGTSVGVRRLGAQDIDRHIAARLRQLRITTGLTQQMLADLIGVTCQQAHKYETGTNRISASRLYLIAKVLEVDPEYFFEGLREYAPSQAPLQQRVFLDLARNFRNIRTPKHQEAICLLTRILANVENGSEELHASTDDGRELSPERHWQAG
jgi:transcriptional regulator with XRE-family HTH domain